MQTIPADWLNTILAETACRCLIKAGEATTPLRVDSSGAETRRLSGPTSGFCPDIPKDILAVPYGSNFWSTDSTICGGNTGLCQRHHNIGHHEFHLRGRWVNTDRVHNSDQNCQGNDTRQQVEEGRHQPFQVQQKKNCHTVHPK